MNENTEKVTLKGVLQTIGVALVCSSIIAAQQIYLHKRKAVKDAESVTKTATIAAKNDTVASGARIHMIQNNATKTR